MLKSIENFLQITKSAVSGIIGILSGYFLRLYLRVDAPDKEIWAVLGVAIVMVFVILFFNWLIEYILERAIWLRRILLRRHFFEGIWIQTIKNDLTTNKPLSNVPHSIVYISYDKGRYKIKGLSYDNEGNHIATFDSHFAEYSYSTNTLEYPFTITTHENTNIKVFGTTQLRFAVTDGMCTNYIGVVSR